MHAGISDGLITEVVDGDLHEGDQVAIDTLDAAAESASSSGRSPFAGGGGGGGRRIY